MTSAATTSKAPPPAPLTSRGGLKKPDIPITTTIFPKTLHSYLTETSLTVLLLDVRPRDTFESLRISHTDIACIEPTVLTRSGIDSMGIESALVLSPRQEETVFRNRDKFDLVVVYDEGSESFGNGNGRELGVLNRVIYETEFVKQLRRPPMILVGGLKRWKGELGMVGLTGTAVVAGGHGVEEKVVNGVLYKPTPVRPVGEVNGRERADSSSAATARSRVDSLGVNGVDAAERDRRRKAHVRDGAVIERYMDCCVSFLRSKTLTEPLGA